MSVTVRDARFEELDTAGRLTQAAFAEFAPPGQPAETWPYHPVLGAAADRSRRTTVLVAAGDDGTLLGTVTLEVTGRVHEEDPPPADDEVHIRMLAVAPSARGRGVGRALMLAAMERARALGRPHITLHTHPRMNAAQALYRSLGFRRLADEPSSSGEPFMTFEHRLTTAPNRYPAADDL